jgi:hypothetical protein
VQLYLLHWFEFVIVASVTIIIVIAATVQIRHAKRHVNPLSLSDRELPTVSVVIPARNETDDLAECIRSILANNYPKLEVLVMDDCSQLTRTPEIIRSFAHDGVRFLAGTEPQPHWLAKNLAYDQLLKAASGELVLFCGVDIRFEPSTIRTLVGSMLAEEADMLSVMPVNVGPQSLIQPMRYAWELAVPRTSAKRPPVLSSCWLASRAALERVGGFAAVSRQVVPEAHFARAFAEHGTYSFLASGSALGIASMKTKEEQRDTAVRTRYPQLHRRPEMVMTTTILEICLLVPFASVVYACWRSSWSLLAAYACLCGALWFSYAWLLDLAYRRHSSLQILLLPFAILSDIAMLHYSMYKYEFSEVLWKGRNICLPVMQVYNQLPSLDEVHVRPGEAVGSAPTAN